MRFLSFFVFFLIGFGLLVIGGVYIISYLNLLSFGYNFVEYVKYISARPECLITPIGFIIICVSIYLLGGNNNELCI